MDEKDDFQMTPMMMINWKSMGKLEVMRLKYVNLRNNVWQTCHDVTQKKYIDTKAVRLRIQFGYSRIINQSTLTKSAQCLALFDYERIFLRLSSSFKTLLLHNS